LALGFDLSVPAFGDFAHSPQNLVCSAFPTRFEDGQYSADLQSFGDVKYSADLRDFADGEHFLFLDPLA
jgi:hypothetical protein